MLYAWNCQIRPNAVIAINRQYIESYIFFLHLFQDDIWWLVVFVNLLQQLQELLFTLGQLIQDVFIGGRGNLRLLNLTGWLKQTNKLQNDVCLWMFRCYRMCVTVLHIGMTPRGPCGVLGEFLLLSNVSVSLPVRRLHFSRPSTFCWQTSVCLRTLLVVSVLTPGGSGILLTSSGHYKYSVYYM